MAAEIQKLGYQSLSRLAKGFLSVNVRVARRVFANAVLGLLVADWIASCHMCIDVKTFKYAKYPVEWINAQARRVYRKKDEGLHPDCTRHTKSHTTGCGGVKFLAGLSWGTNECPLAEHFEGRWNSVQFIAFIPILVAALWQCYPDGPAGGVWLVLFDNDPVFTSAASTAALAAHNIRRATFGPAGGVQRNWPPQFQDCHVIENMFGEADRRLRLSAPNGFESRAAFVTRVRNVLLNMDAAYVQALINSMPQRMAAVVANNGGMTKY